MATIQTTPRLDSYMKIGGSLAAVGVVACLKSYYLGMPFIFGAAAVGARYFQQKSNANKNLLQSLLRLEETIVWYQQHGTDAEHQAYFAYSYRNLLDIYSSAADRHSRISEANLLVNIHNLLELAELSTQVSNLHLDMQRTSNLTSTVFAEFKQRYTLLHARADKALELLKRRDFKIPEIIQKANVMTDQLDEMMGAFYPSSTSSSSSTSGTYRTSPVIVTPRPSPVARSTVSHRPSVATPTPRPAFVSPPTPSHYSPPVVTPTSSPTVTATRTGMKELANTLGFIPFYDLSSPTLNMGPHIPRTTLCFSNFYNSPVMIGVAPGQNMTFRNSEAAFQAGKYYPDDNMMGKFSRLDPDSALTLSRQFPSTRHDWINRTNPEMGANYQWMLAIIRAKFSKEQNPELVDLLLDTGDAYLVEHSPLKVDGTPRDAIWADGHDGRGLNLLGKVLMIRRGELGGRGVVARPDNCRVWQQTKVLSFSPRYSSSSSSSSSRR